MKMQVMTKSPRRAFVTRRQRSPNRRSGELMMRASEAILLARSIQIVVCLISNAFAND